MIRAVLDTNVLVAALLSSEGAPSAIVAAWLDGAFEVVTSRTQLDELRRVSAYPRIARRIPRDVFGSFLELVERHAAIADDIAGDGLAPDRDDDLVALVQASADVLVTGDRALLDAPLPVTTISSRDFLDALGG